MTAEEETGFSFVDKRRVNTDAEPASGDAPSPEEEPAAPPPMDSDDGLPHEHPALRVIDRLLMCIDILHQGAWISMGLVADPGTGEIERNLDDAKLAIDSVAFLASKLEGEMDETVLREVRRLVSDLQVNFVRQKQQV